MKYYHRNYFFLLTASALTTVLWSLTYTTSRYRIRFSLMMEGDGIAETSGFEMCIRDRWRLLKSVNPVLVQMRQNFLSRKEDMANKTILPVQFFTTAHHVHET